MERSFLIIVAVVSLVMLGAFTSYAQTSGGTMDRSYGSKDMSRSSDYSSSSRMDGSMTGGFDMYRLSKLIGSDVRNAQGDTLGEVKDFVVDPEGHVAFALVKHGGVLGLREKFVAVPFTALSYMRDQRRFTLDMDKDRFASAPVFERDTDISNRSWAEDAYRYFGQTPYWSETGSFRSDFGRTGTMSSPD